MKNYFSKIVFSFLFIVFASTRVQADMGSYAMWFDKIVSGKVLLGGLAVAGLGTLAYKYASNYKLQSEIQEKLEPICDQGLDNFSFARYRFGDIYGKGWHTAQSILTNKDGDDGFKKALYDDIQQGDRVFVFVENKKNPCSFSQKMPQKDTYSLIKETITKEQKELCLLIRSLARKTDISECIVCLVSDVLTQQDSSSHNKKPTWAYKVQIINTPQNLDELYTVFSKFTGDELIDFTRSLYSEIHKRTTWRKKIVCPYYEALSKKHWELVKSYIRLCGLKIVVDEEYAAKSR